MDSDWLNSKKGFKYFNAGMLIIKPDVAEGKWLTEHYKKAERREFSEQDMLNDRFRGTWHEVPRFCNWLGPPEPWHFTPGAHRLAIVPTTVQLQSQYSAL